MVIKEKINNYRIDRQTFVARACAHPFASVGNLVSRALVTLVQRNGKTKTSGMKRFR